MTDDVINHYIKAIQTDGRGLTKWEKDFVDDIAGQFAERGRLSERQCEILERIYEDKTA